MCNGVFSLWRRGCRFGVLAMYLQMRFSLSCLEELRCQNDLMTIRMLDMAIEMQKLRDHVFVLGDNVSFVEETKVKKESIWVRQIVNDLDKY